MERVGCALRAASRSPALPAVRVVGFNISTSSSRPSRAQLSRVHAVAQQQPSLQEPPGAGSSASAAASSASARPAASAEGPTFDLACPICLTTELKVQSVGGRPTGHLHCPRCSRTFASNTTYVDATLTSGVKQKAYQPSLAAGTSIFQSPVVSFVYERGWRQGFAWAGFPGADKEYELAMDYLQPAYGETLVDMSCGSGLFSRRFLKSGRFQGVIAADYSESMLGQAKQFLSEDASLDTSRYLLLRCDVGRLPFATGSVAAIHAGAAIHCWPNPQAALAEISRVLRPGGVFVASTFLTFTAPLGQLLGDEVVQPLNRLEPMSGGRSAYRWWQEAELRDLCDSVGLVNFRRARSNRFILFSAAKPGTPEQ